MDLEIIEKHNKRCEAKKNECRENGIEGIWEKEPNRLNWKHAGFDCMLVRNDMLNWCGYVGIKKDHPLFGIGYNEEDGSLQRHLEQKMNQSIPGERIGFGLMIDAMAGRITPKPESVLDVHGGLTYSDKCQGSICHITDDETDETWWFGFDCGHSGDFSPGLACTSKTIGTGAYWNRQENETYRDMEYAKKETEHLADQLEKLR